MSVSACLVKMQEAVGDFPMVTRLDYVMDTGGKGVVVSIGEVDGRPCDKYYAITADRVMTMTVEELADDFETMYANTVRAQRLKAME